MTIQALPRRAARRKPTQKLRPPERAAKPNRRFRWWIIPIAVIVIAANPGCGLVLRIFEAQNRLNAYELLKNYANQDVLVMQADAALTTNGDTSETSVDIRRTSANGQSHHTPHARRPLAVSGERHALSCGRQRLRSWRERADRLWGTARCVRFPVRIG